MADLVKPILPTSPGNTVDALKAALAFVEGLKANPAFQQAINLPTEDRDPRRRTAVATSAAAMPGSD
jgi:hypothetical protein